MTRAGTAAVVGKPNAGKSTLLNRLVGEKLSIVSPKPQSTRDRIVGIHTTDDTQIILLDTPGLLNPRYALQRAMRATAVRALAEADVIIYLVDATRAADDTLSLREAAELSEDPRAPVLLTFSKADLIDAGAAEHLASRAPGALFVSALTGEGIDGLLSAVRAHLPESPFLYPADELSAQPVRFFAAELVRETALEQLQDELPYSLACEIDEFRETREPVYIRAVLHVERESQKRILIGAGGTRIRAIGEAARGKIEALIGRRVYLDLWVKVLPNWRKKPAALRRFGFHLPEEPSS
ncbi:MAG TPA: GTPase Era [Gemmatimonadaceae bacterium]|nr:GTPase Era [Gemmatimonadaceae bacterium]